ncbi:hypothetical protein [Cryobacterium sp. Hz7]|uniref:hypothetical protein n=1 Tax=Cryobacterium sp. Hz7 TaxID=1259166 RepID=UPI0018E097D5|nr:hypothetical protein [Cryobacterium sp. Hz7]
MDETSKPQNNPAEHRAWAVSADRFVKQPRPKPASATGRPPAPRTSLSSSATQVQLEETGITWDRSAVDWSLLERSTVGRARSRFRASLPEYIWDAAALEGNPYTLPEVQTLLEGITVTGHRIADQDQILALNEGFNLTDELVGTSKFHLDKATSDEIHAKVAVYEAIESGHFRGEGSAGGGGHVSIGSLGTFHASEPGENGTNLKREFSRLRAYLLEDVEDPREQAIAYFCAATRRQFYFDGNKRTAKLMMAGHLMQNSYDAISISARRQLEFNQLLAPLFDTGEATEMMQFIIDSRPA